MPPCHSLLPSMCMHTTGGASTLREDEGGAGVYAATTGR